MKKIILIGMMGLLSCFSGIRISGAQAPEAREPILVGRIAHLEGQLLRYVPSEQDWVATVQDAPFGLEDALYTDRAGRAELILPNNTWIRISGDTQIQLVSLKEDLTEIDVGSGLVRFYNKSTQAEIRAETSFGYVLAPPKTIFDLVVGENSVEIIPLRGTVTFVHAAKQSRYEVVAGSSSLLADRGYVNPGDGSLDSRWDNWNKTREELWRQRLGIRSASSRYLPEELLDQGYVLDDNGRWERVQYEGGHYYFWRPVQVRAGWAPFTEGRWTVWYDDHCWIPNEPFGYVTHHYGNWFYLNGFWYWAPPAARLRAVQAGPALNIHLAWYPGRVSWIHSGAYIGWIPLAPFEPYYCYRPWGPNLVVIARGRPWSHSLPIHRYRHYHQAVIINQNHFYSVNNYHRHRIVNTTPLAVRNFQPAPVIDNRVLPHFDRTKERHRFVDTIPREKPPPNVIRRIEQVRAQTQSLAPVQGRELRERAAPVREQPRTEEGSIKMPPDRPPQPVEPDRDRQKMRPPKPRPIQPGPAKEPEPAGQAQPVKPRIKEIKPREMPREQPGPIRSPEVIPRDTPRVRPMKPDKERPDRPGALHQPRTVEPEAPKVQPAGPRPSQIEQPDHSGRPAEGSREPTGGKAPKEAKPPKGGERGGGPSDK